MVEIFASETKNQKALVYSHVRKDEYQYQNPDLPCQKLYDPT